MKLASKSIVAVLQAAAACALATAWQPALAATQHLVLDIGGIKRTALVIEHARLKKARRPIIFVLHGYKGDGARIRRNLDLDDILGTAGAVMVFPDAFEKRWTQSGHSRGNVDDAAFIRGLAERLVAQGLGDARRVYIAGVSTGGIMALQIACDHADLIAGAAIVNASLPAESVASCKPARPLPFLLINGTADVRLPYQGGPTAEMDVEGPVVSTDETLGVFAAIAGCKGERTATPYPSRNPKGGTRAILERDATCKVPVELVKIEGGGHNIPGPGRNIAPASGPHNADVDAARLIFEFFARLKGA